MHVLPTPNAKFSLKFSESYILSNLLLTFSKFALQKCQIFALMCLIKGWGLKSWNDTPVYKNQGKSPPSCLCVTDIHETNERFLILFRCRGKTVKILDSNPFNIVLCVLVLVDAGVVIAEILLDLHAIRGNTHFHYKWDFSALSEETA